MPIEVKEFRPYEKNTLRGFATIRLTNVGLEIRDCTVHEKNGQRWIGLPAKSYEKDDGETGYSYLIAFYEKPRFEQFKKAVLKAIDDYEPPEDPEEEVEPPVLEPRDYREDLWGLRLLLNFSADLQFSSLTQYDTESKELGTNNRLRWTYHPNGEIFLVYNQNVIRDDEKDRWKFVSNELPIKIMYTWRF